MVVTLAVLVSGCGTGGSREQTPSAASPSTTTSVARQELPSCQTVDISYKPPLRDQHIRCELVVDENRTITVSSDPAWSFNLRSDGLTTQEFREPTDQIGESGAVPLLQDIDKSGNPVLLVIVGRGGTGGEPMAVWRLSGQQFVRAGELFGFRRFYRSAVGFFGNYAHSSAASGVVSLYRWDADKLVKAITLDVQVADLPRFPDDRGEWIRNGNVDCTVSTNDYPLGSLAERQAAMRSAGIDPATAAHQFCTQPWVGTLYR